MKRYVIVGGSIAGVSCVEGIRSRDGEGEITLVTAEPVSNYGRPHISYYLEGKTDLKRMSWRGEDFFARNRVNILHATRADKLDAAALCPLQLIPDAQMFLEAAGRQLRHPVL